MELKKKRKSNYKFDNSEIKVGDIFYTSWGYDQTNIDYYKVRKLIGKASVELVPIESRMDYDNGNRSQDAVLPYPAAEGEPMQKKIKYAIWDNYREPRINMTSYCDAYLWDGKPKYQTNINYRR
jgi:hypothetical protein